jgi:hypothetical protein
VGAIGPGIWTRGFLYLLNFEQRDDLLQFLDSLNGKLPDNVGPPAHLAPPANTSTSGK